MDIRTFTGMGITPYRAQWIDYTSNSRNTFRYKIKFIAFNYNDNGEEMTGVFKIIRYSQQNGEWIIDINYDYQSKVDMFSYVDFFGNIVNQTIDQDTGEVDENDEPIVEQIPNPDVWGTEFDYMAVLFASPIPDNLIMESYQHTLFNKGVFDYPKYRNV